MNMPNLTAALAIVALLAGPLAACTSTSTSESTGEYIDDTAISNKVRALLIDDKDLNLFQIDVTTYKGTVQLSGFVNSQAIKERAGVVAASVDGVQDVVNNLIVK
jgi:hyperosmotically inducible protein